uniref:titin n=1 Tax=Ciona intestinalis TaxID=7719 RepID=UPI0005215FDD|nr:titin [Ciona intestinalis]|eukprot:XP_009861626.1 titin [Ciona intestinalis]
MVAMVNSNHNNKEHRKKLQQYLKTSYVHHVIGNHEPHPPSPPTSPTPHKPGVRTENALLKLRMQYLKILLPQHLYGGRYFDATIMALPESDITLLVGHHYGVSQLVNSKTKMSSMFADFTVVKSVEVAPCLPDSRKTNVRVDFKDLPPLVLAMHPVSAQNFAFMISGYCRVHGNNEMMLTLPIADNLAPEYFGSHKVKPSLWNYPPNHASQAVFCDFSEPVTSTLICHEIPDEVRAMYQQSFIERETHQTSHTTDDEGVATPNTDLSPLSSASSMTSSAMTSSSSPSSGIGSVTSKNDKPTLDEVPAANDDNEWDELMVALYTDNELPHSPLSPPETNNETLDDNKQQIVSVSDQEDSFVENKDDVSSMEDYVVTHDRITPPENNAEVIQSLECNGDNNNGTIEETSTEFDGKDISKEIAVNITEETTYVSPTSSVGETQQKDEAVAVKRPRFSSFKPSSHENSLSPDPKLQENAITSDQLQARIDPLTLDVAGATFDIENEEIVTSPLPVTDLARDLQKKKRRSWISVSAKKSEGKKNKSFIRGLFSPSRSYALNRKNESETNSAKKWKFGNIFKSSPERGSRFFSFKAFSRRKRSHTLNTSATNSPEGNQVYSVFPTEEPGQLQRSFSVENVSLRPRAKPTNPRPVSFMTFLPLNGNGNVENVEDDETTPAPASPEMNDFSSKVKESEDLEIERKSAPAKPQRPSLQHSVDEVAEIIIPTSKKKKRAPMCLEDVVYHAGNEDQKLGRDSVKVEDCDVTVHETYVENVVETPVQHNEKQNEIMKQAVYENVAVETTVVVEKVHEEIVDEEKQIVEKQDFVEEPSYNVTMQQSESLDINSFEVDLDDDLTIDPTLNEVTMGRDESILVEEIFAYLDAPVDKSSYSLSSDGSSGEDRQLDLCEEHDTKEPDQLVQTTVLEKPVELVEKFENLETAVEKPEQQKVVESAESFVEKEETVGQTEFSFKKVPEEEQFVERQEFVEKENRVVETPESFVEKQNEIFDEEKLVESVVDVKKPQVVETADSVVEKPDSVVQTEFNESQEIVVEKETEIVEENPFVENQESPIENFHEEKEFVEKENQNVEKPGIMVKKQNEIVEEKKEFVKSQIIVTEKLLVAEKDIIDEEEQLVEKPKPFVEKDKKFNLEKQELMENHETAIPLVNGNKGLVGKMGQTKVHASLVGIQSSGDIPCDHSLDGKDCQEIDANNSDEQTPRRANDVINGPFISAKQVNSVNTTTSQTAELHEIIESETEKRNSKPTNVTPHAATLRPSYHSLISPRIFQHSKERKVFSSIKPPVMNSQRKTNGTGPRKISSVSVTRPVVPPKPSYL